MSHNNYISFVVITDTPGRVATFLSSRGIIEQNAQGNWVGVRPGMEWVKVPNPIVTDPGSGTFGEEDYVPPTHDTRSVFLVKFAHESVDFEVDGELTDGEGNAVNQYDWSKFGQWVKANSSVVDAPANYLINGEPAGNAYKINGENVWLVRDNPERFGVWQ
jgi:hypothetical protein